MHGSAFRAAGNTGCDPWTSGKLATCLALEVYCKDRVLADDAQMLKPPHTLSLLPCRRKHLALHR